MFRDVRNSVNSEVSLKTAIIILGITIVMIATAVGVAGYRFIWYQVNNTSIVELQLRAAREAARRNPQDPGKIAAVGDQYLHQGDINRALTEYEKAYAMKPRDSSIRFNLGVLYKEKKEYQKSISLLSEVLRENPHHYLALVNIGMAYMEKGNHQKAIQAFEKAVAINPGAADIYLLLGGTYDRMGKKEEALVNIDKALKFVPAYSEALEAKKRITQPR